MERAAEALYHPVAAGRSRQGRAPAGPAGRGPRGVERGSVEPKIKIWVAFGEQTKFGEGRARLFELIDRLGSINKAVAHLGMSYRMVWGYIRELENAAGFRLLERARGRGTQAGTRLTREGREFVKQYWSFHHELEDAVGRHFTRAFRNHSRRPSRARRRPRRVS